MTGQGGAAGYRASAAVDAVRSGSVRRPMCSRAMPRPVSREPRSRARCRRRVLRPGDRDSFPLSLPMRRTGVAHGVAPRGVGDGDGHSLSLKASSRALHVKRSVWRPADSRGLALDLRAKQESHRSPAVRRSDAGCPRKRAWPASAGLPTASSCARSAASSTRAPRSRSTSGAQRRDVATKAGETRQRRADLMRDVGLGRRNRAASLGAFAFGDVLRQHEAHAVARSGLTIT